MARRMHHPAISRRPRLSPQTSGAPDGWPGCAPGPANYRSRNLLPCEFSRYLSAWTMAADDNRFEAARAAHPGENLPPRHPASGWGTFEATTGKRRNSGAKTCRLPRRNSHSTRTIAILPRFFCHSPRRGHLSGKRPLAIQSPADGFAALRLKSHIVPFFIDRVLRSKKSGRRHHDGRRSARKGSERFWDLTTVGWAGTLLPPMVPPATMGGRRSLKGLKIFTERADVPPPSPLSNPLCFLPPPGRSNPRSNDGVVLASAGTQPQTRKVILPPHI